MTDTAKTNSPWIQCPVEERVERIRTIIKNQQGTIDYLSEMVWKLERQLNHHEHLLGTVVLPITEVNKGYQDLRPTLENTRTEEDFF